MKPRALPSPGLALLVAALVACGQPRSGTLRTAPAPPLRVAVPAEAPPYAWAEGGRFVGLEVDFAREMAAALGRPLDLRALDFGDLLPALSAGSVDLVMAGLTVTPARQVEIAFSDPYLNSGLLALLRREDADRYPTPRSVVDRGHAIGVVQGTTGERFVRERARVASLAVYPAAPAAVDELRERRIDAVVHDAPVTIWFASRDEANLVPLLRLLNQEQLGWGLRRGDEALRASVNGVLARWRADGTRDRVLARWLPYWQRLESAERAR